MGPKFGPWAVSQKQPVLGTMAAASNAVFSAVPRALGEAPDPGASAVAGVVAGLAFFGATWLPEEDQLSAEPMAIVGETFFNR